MDLSKVKQEIDFDLRYLLTGTQVYGPVSEDSDLDIVMLRDGVAALVAFLDEHEIEIYRTPGQDEYGDDGGFYFNLGPLEVNIIVAADALDFEEWKRRTEMMKKLPPIKDREERVAIFREKEVKS